MPASADSSVRLRDRQRPLSDHLAGMRRQYPAPRMRPPFVTTSLTSPRSGAPPRRGRCPASGQRRMRTVWPAAQRLRLGHADLGQLGFGVGDTRQGG